MGCQPPGRIVVRRGLTFAASLAALVVLCPQPVDAIVQPTHVPGDGHRMGTAGTPLRPGRDVVHGVVPARAQRSWSRLEAELGPSWASWDAATGVPTRVFGHGLPAPGAIADAQVAEVHAEAFLSKHLDLLAPGTGWADFELTSNHESRGIRSVGYRQLHDGVPVHGAALSVRFKGDQLSLVASTAIPMDRVAITPVSGVASPGQLLDAAVAWVTEDVEGSVVEQSIPNLSPVYLPLVDEAGPLSVRPVIAVDIALRGPASRWTVWLDARSGDPVAREQTLRFANVPVVYRVPQRGPWDGLRDDRPAPRMATLVDGEVLHSDGLGVLTVPDDASTLLFSAAGTDVEVTNQSGDPAVHDLALTDLALGETAIWDASDDEQVDAQLTTFIYANEVKNYVRAIGTAADVAWLDEALPANVNIDDACNAFWDGSQGTVNFFAAGVVSDTECENTGRLADVIHHEFGHGIHNRALIDDVGVFDVALSEGISDYLAATIVDDPDMGRGFFGDERPIRQLDPENYEWHWPEDRGEVHAEGRIIGGTLWDLRKAFIELYGEEQGVARTDLIWFEAPRRATDIPSMYFETLLIDDDDGDLSNGTPHACLISEIFGNHGLYQASIEAALPDVTPVSEEGLELEFEVHTPFPECGIETSALLDWRLRREPYFAGQTPFDIDGGTYRVTLPPVPSGTVLQYRAIVEHDNGSTQSRPYNLQDPWYETFIGEVEPIYCTDFETDPELEGWIHGGDENADEWAWGPPGGASGDPASAYSGEHVFGQDLGGNGKYAANAMTWARSPAIDVGDYEVVRLQYRRWLEVEDGYYDQARLLVNGETAWTPFATDEENAQLASKHHRDGEWRFHDLDIGEFVEDERVQVTFDLTADGGLQMGGWTLDDFCIVGYEPVNTCGDGVWELGEACDDGNRKNGDGCSRDCTIEVDGDGGQPSADDDDGCACRATGSDAWADAQRGLGLALGLLALGWWRRRERIKLQRPH